MVNAARRAATALNHTATHILHAVLRQVLGDHVKQAGSRVAPDRLRFDFTHFSPIDNDTLETIENLVNQRIRQNIPTDIAEMDADDAFKSGATALFEEKYGDRVRVVSLTDFSRELCGGTHTARTGDIGLFKIVSESSIASGVRRIEALTGQSALAFVQQRARVLNETAHLLKDKARAVPARVKKMLTDIKAFEKEVEQLKTRLATEATETSANAVRTVDGTRVMAQKVSVDTPAARYCCAGWHRRFQSDVDRRGYPGSNRPLPRRQYYQGDCRRGWRPWWRQAGHGPGRREPAQEPR